MNAGTLHMLHDAGNQHIFPIADSVCFRFNAHQVLVNQDRVFNPLCQNDLHVLNNVAILIGDDHVLTAKHVAGANQHRIAQGIRCLQSFLRGHHRAALWALDAVLFHGCIEAFPILCRINGICRGAQNAHAGFAEGMGQLDGRLPAEGRHHAYRLFCGNDPHHIFHRQGLEVQAICRVKVRGDGFRVVVNHDHIVACFFQHPHAVHRSIVELNALTDPNRARAKHHHTGLLGTLRQEFRCLVFLIIGSVEVRRLGSKFSGAGVHHLIHRVPMGSHLLPRQTFNGLIRIAHPLGLQVSCFIHFALLQPLLHQVQVQVLIQEEIVDFRDFMELLQGHAPANGLIHGEHPLVGALSNQVQQLFGALLRHALHPQGIAADFCPADRLHQRLFHIHANGHHFAGSLHLGAQVPLAINELVEGPLGQLGHDIVQCRLEAGTGLAGHGVLHFVQRIADGNLSSTLGDRIPGGLAGQGRRAAYPRVHLDNRILE